MWALLSLLLVVSSAQMNCPSYSCAVPGNELPDNVCLEPLKSGNYWMSLCPGFTSDFGCVPSDIPGATLYCGEPPLPEVEPSYPGEPCITEYDCAANQTAHCIENMCTGLGIKSACAQDYDCGLGFYCDLTTPAEGTCQFQLELNEVCTRDQECLNYLGCTGVTNSTGIFPGKCIPYFSITNGQAINLCVDNDGEGFSRLCASSTCLPNNPEENGPGVCIPAYVSGTGVQTCEQDSDCVGFSGTLQATKTCQCGLSVTAGAGYCPLFGGDYTAMSVIDFTQTLLATNMSDCHTSHRFSDFCFQKYLTDDFASYRETVELATNFFLYQNNDNCVKANLLNDYYQLTAELLECPAYSCATNLGASQCAVFNQGNNTYELATCAGGNVCGVASLNVANVTCSAPPVPTAYLYPGDNCTAAAQCISGTCTGGLCVGVQVGKPCTDSSVCGINLYCSNFVCATLIQANSVSACYADSDCVLTAGCNMANNMAGTCTSYFSLKNGAAVYCPTSGWQPLCQSNMCAHKTGLTVGQCVAAATSVSALPMQCHSDSDCIDSTGVYTSKCVCGYNPTGTKYCTLFPGDVPFANYTRQVQSVITNTNSGNVCQTTRRFEADCIMNIQRQTNSDQSQLLSAFYYATMFPQLQRNDPCVQSLFTNEYWSIPQPIINNNTNNTSVGVELAAAGVMWLTFG